MKKRSVATTGMKGAEKQALAAAITGCHATISQCRQADFSRLWVLLLGLAVFLTAINAQSGTIWTGPLFTFTEGGTNPTQASNQDRITPDVWLTRAASKGLFNAYSETNATTLSPANTEWSFGVLSNYQSLHYTNWLAWLAGQSPTSLVGQQVVLHLISDDIYLSLQMTMWGSNSSGGFAYLRSTPVPLAVSITDPAAGAVFAAPASVQLAAETTGGAATVTNVEFFTNGIAAGAVTGLPFTLATAGLPAGSYSISASATSAGISATSPPVTVTVVMPAAIVLTSTGVSNGGLNFNYSANAGLSYVVESSTNLADWIPLATNVAGANLMPFSDPVQAGTFRFYRVGLLPNP